MQFQLVTQLLVDTSMPLATVARRAGFEHAEYLSVAFKKRFSMPPSEYRQLHRR
jgi:transcriptional regulator GlxA family with amidase domain